MATYFSDNDPMYGSPSKAGLFLSAQSTGIPRLPNASLPGNDAARGVIENAYERFAEIAELYQSKLVEPKLSSGLRGDFHEQHATVNQLRDLSIDRTSEQLRRILEKVKTQNPLLNSLDIDRFVLLHEDVSINVSELMVGGKEPQAHLRKDGRRHIIAHPLDVVVLAVEILGPSCQSVPELYALMLTAQFHDSLEDCKAGHPFARERIKSVLSSNRISSEITSSVLEQVDILTIKRGTNSKASVDSHTDTFDPTPWSRKIAGYEFLLHGSHELSYEFVQGLRIKGIDCLANSIDLIKRIHLAEKSTRPDVVRQILATSQAYEFLCSELLSSWPNLLGDVTEVVKHALELNQCVLGMYPDSAPLNIIKIQ